MTHHIPSREQCTLARAYLGLAHARCARATHAPHDIHRQDLADAFLKAAAALFPGYTFQSPEEAAREKALVEAAHPLIAGLEDLPPKGQTWVLIDDLRILAKTLAAYDPPAVTSTPGAPHDGRAPGGPDFLSQPLNEGDGVYRP